MRIFSPEEIVEWISETEDGDDVAALSRCFAANLAHKMALRPSHVKKVNEKLVVNPQDGIFAGKQRKEIRVKLGDGL